AGLHTRLQIAAEQVLHGEIFEPRVHTVVVNLHYQRIADGNDGSVLTLENLPAGDVVAQSLADFQRHVASERNAGGEIHHRFLRFPDLHFDDVAGDEFRGDREAGGVGSFSGAASGGGGALATADTGRG